MTEKNQAPDPAPRFANVSCSQCGREFGPGNAGFSHCQDHQATSLPEFNSSPFAWARWSTTGLGPDIMVGSLRPDGDGWFSVHARFDDMPAIPAPEGAQLPEAAAFIVHRAMCEPALEWSEGDGWRNEPLFTADQMHAYARAALAAPAPQAPVALTDEQESAPLLLWNGGYYIRGRLVVEKSWAANAGSLAEPYFILAPQTKEPTNDR